MDITPIDSLYQQTPTPPAPQELDRDAFMQLLVSQLQNQDPLEPVQNEDFVAQLATFSSLEQLEGVNDGITGLLLLEQGGQITSQLAEGSSLIGKQVGWYDPSTDLRGSGVVDSVKVVDDLTTVTVDGQDIPLYWIDEVAPVEPFTDLEGDDSAATDESPEGDEPEV
ncbi:MAG: flagellar hook capping FlgD N-terminal domain-containing protein [Planctomycetota bacterium]